MTTHLFDASLYDEAQQLNKRTSREDLTTNTLIESLAFSRDAVRRLDEEFDEHVGEFKEAMKPYEVDRKALKAVFEGAASKFEERLVAILRRDKNLPSETNNGVRLTIAMLARISLHKVLMLPQTFKGVKLIDGTLTEDKKGVTIEPRFLLPVEQWIDWKAVQAAAKAGEELPLWVDQFNQVSLRTTLPEVTE